MRKCTFHAFSVVSLNQRDETASADLIWNTLTNPSVYVDGIANLTGRHSASGYMVELREFNQDGLFATGCIAKCREDSPPIRRPDRSEVLRALGSGDTYLEKNYFLYSKSDRVLIWHFNLSGNGYSSFAQMLNILSGQQATFICEPKVKRMDMDFDQVEIEYLDFAVSMPTGKRDQRRLMDEDPTDWGGLNPFVTMNQMAARKFAGKFVAKRSVPFSSKLIRLATSLSVQPTIRRLKVKLEDCDEPIDVLASRFKATRDINFHQGQHLDSASMFEALRDVWAEYEQQANAGP